MSVIAIDEFGDDSGYDFVPYRLRMPITDDLHALREELSLQVELHGARSVEAQVAFENLFATSCRIGRPLDGLRRHSRDEDERFFAQTRTGTDGHVYWLGAKGGFTRNDGSTRRPARWWWEKLHGPLAPTTDVVANCGQKGCIEPTHQYVGRDMARRQFTDEQMLNALQVMALQLGRPPNSIEWEKNGGRPMPSRFKLRFGGWSQALYKAGLIDEGASYDGYRKKATPELSVASLQEARRFLGHIPGYEEFRSDRVRLHLKGLRMLTSQTSIKRQIGPSWQDAIRHVFGGGK